MRKCKARVLLLALAASLCAAQTATEYEGPEVLRVGAKLNCNCGCKQNMACQMQPPCSVCKAARIKILALQKEGKSDEEILAAFVAERGKDVLVVPPGKIGFTGPYIALALGLLVVIWAIRRYMGLRPAVPAEIDEAALKRYHDQIEKDLAKLD